MPQAKTREFYQKYLDERGAKTCIVCKKKYLPKYKRTDIKNVCDKCEKDYKVKAVAPEKEAVKAVVPVKEMVPVWNPPHALRINLYPGSPLSVHCPLDLWRRQELHITTDHPDYKSYEITDSEYNDLRNKQGSACAICGVRIHALLVDHDHATGKVRGLLCCSCNTGLGFFKDKPINVINAYKYLLRSKAL